MKKTTRILPLVFSVVLLLVFVTASARARSNPNPGTPIPGEVIAQIRWKKNMGLIPTRPGSAEASTSACSPFFIVAVTLGMGPVKSEILAHSPASTSQPKEDEEYYRCTYSMRVPLDSGLLVIPLIGDVDLLPKMSRQTYYSTDQWIGGTNSRPPASYRRGFNDFEAVNRGPDSKSILLRFEMIYVHGVNPNPTLPPSTPLSEEGPSPLLNRATQFAGAWKANFGGGFLTMIFQQTGARVSGQLVANSADFGFIRDGMVVDNTLRFTVMRRSPYGGNFADVQAGVGELVLDADGKSFKGTVLGVPTSGTFISR